MKIDDLLELVEDYKNAFGRAEYLRGKGDEAGHAIAVKAVELAEYRLCLRLRGFDRPSMSTKAAA